MESMPEILKSFKIQALVTIDHAKLNLKQNKHMQTAEGLNEKGDSAAISEYKCSRIGQMAKEVTFK